MNRKTLSEDLIYHGFSENKYHQYEIKIDNLSYCVRIYSSLFGKITMVGIFYKFKSELLEEFHDEVWDKSLKIFNNNNNDYILGSLGCEQLEVNIINKNILKQINAQIIYDNCNKFANQLKQLIDEFYL